jgi:hypothetical protein
VGDDCSFDIFGMVARTSKPTNELFKFCFIMFKCFQVDVKEMKCSLWWLEKRETVFQIEIERIFSLISILTNFKKC